LQSVDKFVTIEVMRETRLISWITAARKEFEEFPEDVQSDIFDGLTLAAEGGKSDNAKPFKGVDGGVFEIALRYRGDAFRALYAVKIGADIWVIQAFQKKSKSGIQNAANGGRSYPGTAQTIEGGFEMKNDDMELVRGLNRLAPLSRQRSSTSSMSASFLPATPRN
jgi:phage-related protein